MRRCGSGASRCLFAPSLLGRQNGQQRVQRVGGIAVVGGRI